LTTPNLSFHLNTSIVAVLKRDGRTISAVDGHVANAEVEITIEGSLFMADAALTPIHPHSRPIGRE